MRNLEGENFRPAGCIAWRAPGLLHRPGAVHPLRCVKERLRSPLILDQQVKEEQREIDRLYGKLAAASPLTDAEFQHALQEVLHRLETLAQSSWTNE